VVYLETEIHGWPGPRTAPGKGNVLNVGPDSQLDDVAAKAIALSTSEVQGFYHASGGHPVYFPAALRDASVEPPELIAFPLAIPDATGELIWTEGGRHLITIGDLKRAKDQGLFNGDPTGVFLEGPFFGEAPPGWLDFIDWLSAIGSAVSGAALLIAFIRRRFERWKSRGAVTPFAFLDLVVARDEWNQEHLAKLLGISLAEAADLLTAMGFVAAGDRWRVAGDPKTSALRRKIIEDYLHRTYGN
jgi:hypothetical protein